MCFIYYVLSSARAELGGFISQRYIPCLYIVLLRIFRNGKLSSAAKVNGFTPPTHAGTHALTLCVNQFQLALRFTRVVI